MHNFWDSVPPCEIHGCYLDTQKFWAKSSFPCEGYGAITGADVNKLLQKVSKHFYTVYTFCKLYYSIICCWQITTLANSVKFEWCCAWLIHTMLMGSREVKKTLVESEFTLYHWLTLSGISDCSRSLK